MELEIFLVEHISGSISVIAMTISTVHISSCNDLQ